MSLATLRSTETPALTADQIATAKACNTQWAWSIPSCWSVIAANAYERIEYGRITRPEDVQPPVPLSPQTAADMTSGEWTPDDGINGSIAAYGQRLRERIAADEAAGSYNPEGNLPIDASQLSDMWDRYGLYAMAAAGLIGAAVLLKRGNRR